VFLQHLLITRRRDFAHQTLGVFRRQDVRIDHGSKIPCKRMTALLANAKVEVRRVSLDDRS
jgi:hypothetical protein